MAKTKNVSTDPVDPNAGAAATTLPDGTPLVADAAAALFRDKSGQPFSTIGSEGAANLGAVTAAARAMVTPKDAA